MPCGLRPHLLGALRLSGQCPAVSLPTSSRCYDWQAHALRPPSPPPRVATVGRPSHAPKQSLWGNPCGAGVSPAEAVPVEQSLRGQSLWGRCPACRGSPCGTVPAGTIPVGQASRLPTAHHDVSAGWKSKSTRGCGRSAGTSMMAGVSPAEAADTESHLREGRRDACPTGITPLGRRDACPTGITPLGRRDACPTGITPLGRRDACPTRITSLGRRDACPTGITPLGPARPPDRRHRECNRKLWKEWRGVSVDPALPLRVLISAPLTRS